MTIWSRIIQLQLTICHQNFSSSHRINSLSFWFEFQPVHIIWLANNQWKSCRDETVPIVKFSPAEFVSRENQPVCQYTLKPTFTHLFFFRICSLERKASPSDYGYKSSSSKTLLFFSLQDRHSICQLSKQTTLSIYPVSVNFYYLKIYI